VHWYNTERLMHRLDRVPPAKAKADYYAANESRMLADWGEPVARHVPANRARHTN